MTDCTNHIPHVNDYWGDCCFFRYLDNKCKDCKDNLKREDKAEKELKSRLCNGDKCWIKDD